MTIIDKGAMRQAVFEACQSIDAAAGVARRRYITDVPGQQGTYLVKAEQAAAYITAHAADADAAVPPYIAAEAAATGATPIDAATNIDAIATQWNDVIGPALEQVRIGGKAAATAAGAATDATEADVIAARDAAINALQAIGGM